MGVRLRNAVVISLVCEVVGIERLNESVLVVVELFQRARESLFMVMVFVVVCCLPYARL